ncbi:hypothetical protein FB446DRAFT_508614 [Lentinula raphanica]|nr:hypothetical protein FB446DRAFT_508614 [Lentinula raphanica]
MFYRKIFFPTTTSRRLPSMNCLALQMVFVIGTVSTALAAPTLIPPSEAFPGHDNPSDEPLHQLQPATGFLTVRLDVREPQETAIFLDGSGDIFNKTRALSAGEESSDAPLPHPFHADKFSAIETDVHEPQTTTIALVESVTVSVVIILPFWIDTEPFPSFDDSDCRVPMDSSTRRGSHETALTFMITTTTPL